MSLGRLDVCLRVTSAVESSDYYGRLGFRPVEGDPASGWVVMTAGEARIGLFESEFMGADGFSLNFRGGDIASIAARLAEHGIALDRPVRLVGTHGGNFALRDPDGHLLFFDSSDAEHAELAQNESV